jgi:hypothetical protein
MTVTVIDAAANNLGIQKENILFDDFTGTLTPSLDLIYQKLEISNKSGNRDCIALTLT